MICFSGFVWFESLVLLSRFFVCIYVGCCVAVSWSLVCSMFFYLASDMCNFLVFLMKLCCLAFVYGLILCIVYPARSVLFVFFFMFVAL